MVKDPNRCDPLAPQNKTSQESRNTKTSTKLKTNITLRDKAMPAPDTRQREVHLLVPLINTSLQVAMPVP